MLGVIGSYLWLLICWLFVASGEFACCLLLVLSVFACGLCLFMWCFVWLFVICGTLLFCAVLACCLAVLFVVTIYYLLFVLMLRFIIGRDFEFVGWVVYDMLVGFLRLDDFVL